MKVRVEEMNRMVLELVGLETMPEDSDVVCDNGKEVKRILAGIDMDPVMLMLAKHLGFGCVAKHHPSGILNPDTSDLFGGIM